ncbi:GNAT family N-acetyltransferase [Kineococcus glutinatus]|uniref:GNAT family N-acetyltransferase n=1 Tax=Kineococcus glutinatus TaxID=1070872 RepID=A0ABP9HHY0_9ACTN
MSPQLRAAPLTAVDPAALYAILRLRVDVFVVEQACAYPELDGRDLEPDALQLWAEEDGRVVAAARLLRDPDGRARIGRVVVAPPARGSGLAGLLLQRALELAGDVDVVLDAQSHLQALYARHGFAVDGPPFVEDGIEHVPMLRRA